VVTKRWALSVGYLQYIPADTLASKGRGLKFLKTDGIQSEIDLYLQKLSFEPISVWNQHEILLVLIPPYKFL
jgi:hypothetical protein